ncbi:MAG: exo-alpha-sialidase, partial [bacterium]|nr:exo-alpha-sialidase [bacterium]
MHSPIWNRREWLGIAAGAGLLHGSPPATVESIDIISLQPNIYHGWPTLARSNDGRLLLVCSGGRESHVCPFGRVELMISRDDGNSWSWPRVLMDSDIDDRDAGIVETAQGSLLVTTFTSLAYEDVWKRDSGSWTEEKRKRWTAIDRRCSPAERKRLLGTWMLRSTDRGVTW